MNSYLQGVIRPAPPSPVKTALITLVIAVIVAMLAARGASARDANWKLLVTIDYASTGKVTDSECFPSAAASAPLPVSAASTREVTLRTVRPTSIQMYEAPSGTPATIRVGPPYRAQVTETRTPGIETSGSPTGCFGSGAKQECGTRSLRSGAYVSPLGGIHSWKGFTFEAEKRPSFSDCGVAPAEGKLPDPYLLELKASPAALTGHAQKLVFHRTQSFHAGARDHSLSSEATAKRTYTVRLIHR